MKHPDHDDRAVDDALIDRLVDGELTPQELRAAVSRIESAPDGWKRCALAFMEAQALKESFRALAQPEKREPDAVLPLFAAPVANHARRRWARAAAAAVVVGLSFAIGWVAHEPRSPSALLANQPDSSRNPSTTDLSESSAPEAPGTLVDVATGDFLADANGAVRAVALVRFGPEESPAEVPVLSGPGITADWLVEQPPPVSDYSKAILAREGYQVEQRRRYFTTVLADGRRVAIPIDQVQIQYTGNEPM